MIGRRTLLLGGGTAGLTALGGCGFHPLYGPLAANSVAVHPELAAIYVAVMAERQGQLLRQALQRRLAGTDDSGPKQYELTGGLSLNLEALGIQTDTSATRIRIIGTGDWKLTTLGLAPKPLTNGSARALDGYNVNNQQYFAADLEQGAAIGRLAETIADQITLDLAVFFRNRAPTPA